MKENTNIFGLTKKRKYKYKYIWVVKNGEYEYVRVDKKGRK